PCVSSPSSAPSPSSPPRSQPQAAATVVQSRNTAAARPSAARSACKRHRKLPSRTLGICSSSRRILRRPLIAMCQSKSLLYRFSEKEKIRANSPVSEYINHNPFATTGRQAALDVLVPALANPNLVYDFKASFAGEG